MTSNRAKLEAAYRIWGDSRGANMQPFLDFIDETFVMRSVAPQPPGLEFAGLRKGPEALKTAFQTMLDAWTMESYNAEALLGDSDQVAMFGTCSFTFKGNRKTVVTPIANLWTFRNGKAVECVEIFDSALAIKVASAPPA